MKLTIDKGLNDYDIDLIHVIEEALDVALVRQGFARTTTTKENNYIEFNYRQFGRCLKESKS